MIQRALQDAIGQHVSLTEAEWAVFSCLFRPRSVKKKTVLLSVGEMCQTQWFVLDGCLRLYAADQSGREQTLCFGTKHWWLTDTDAFSTQTPAQMTIEAVEDSELLGISRTDLDRLYQEVPSAERLFRLVWQKTTVALQRRLLSHLSKTADEQYVDFTNQYPSLEQRLSQQQIADYLGITPEYFSKIRKRVLQQK